LSATERYELVHAFGYTYEQNTGKPDGGLAAILVGCDTSQDCSDERSGGTQRRDGLFLGVGDLSTTEVVAQNDQNTGDDTGIV
jgi:hypothetical protein